MKKTLTSLILLFITTALILCLTGCGTPPLAKAYKHLVKLSEKQAGSQPSYSIVKPLQLKYIEEKDALTVKFDSAADLDEVFDVLSKDLDGKDIGTLIFLMNGTRGDGFENRLNKKMEELSCSSIKMLGVDFHITEPELANHGWTKLAEKSEALYLRSTYGLSDVYHYDRTEQKRLDDITHVDVAYEGNEYFASYSILKNLESISLVSEDIYDIEESEENKENKTPEPLDFSYNAYSYSDPDLLVFSEMENLKTLLIYPDTGYKLTESGEKFIASLKYIAPELQVNRPEETDSDDDADTTAVKEIKTPSLDESEQIELLSNLIQPGIKDIYSKCKKFSKKSGEAELNGKVLVYEDRPPHDSWKNTRAVCGSGKCMIYETKSAGLEIPKTVKDFQTFVLIYPTYKQTGHYTHGTKAYTKTLHVQVFDTARKIAYDPVTADTAAAPHSFTYYVGNMPDKHSGTTNTEKAFSYLKKLQK